MRYMFLIYSQETDEPRSQEEMQQVMQDHAAVLRDAGRKGVLLGVERLKSTGTATTVRFDQGFPVTVDGPFAETKEQLAGYYILECKDLDEAIEWGKRIPTVCKGREGCIEIRPVDDLPKLP
ncbi:MAG TPA: YciI family protein [Terriglobia bacterium]|jgi:hypothetical protein